MNRFSVRFKNLKKNRFDCFFIQNQTGPNRTEPKILSSSCGWLLCGLNLKAVFFGWVSSMFGLACLFGLGRLGQLSYAAWMGLINVFVCLQFGTFFVQLLGLGASSSASFYVRHQWLTSLCGSSIILLSS